jgi:hypothetical protein
MAERHTRPKQERLLEEAADNIAKTADWLLANAGGQRQEPEKGLAHAQ